NPKVQDAVYRMLGSMERVHLLKPVGYLGLMSLIERAHIVLTDSGGLREEVPSFGKPILILRDVTERPEVVAAGCARPVGTSTSSIVNNTSELITFRTSICGWQMQVILLVTGTRRSGSWRNCLTRSGEKSLVTAGTPNTMLTFSFGFGGVRRARKLSGRSISTAIEPT